MGGSGVLTAVSVGASGVALVAADERMLLAAAPMVLFTGLVLFVLLVLAGFCAVAAWRIEKGGGRAAQTVAALASVTSVPLGTAYGLYALWVCCGLPARDAYRGGDPGGGVSDTVRRPGMDVVSAWAVRAQAATIDLCVGQLDGDYDPADGCLGGGVSLQALAECEDLNRTTLDVNGTLEVPLLAVGGDRGPERAALRPDRGPGGRCGPRR